ncbi:MAG: hypothetical protein P8K77_02470 [Polaribacter sp.]|nr:hypothetical protein [Polaribacter sp.]
MLRFYKLISTLLHPIVIPTLGTLLFLSITPHVISIKKQYMLLAIVFVATYVIPLTALLVLKTIGVINSFKVTTIKEQKTLLFALLSVFYILGSFFYSVPVFEELGLLFYGTTMAIVVVYFLFFINIKTSLHIVSISSIVGFFLIFGNLYSISILPIIGVLIFLTGVLASAQLHLKAHTPLEIYFGFFVGVFCQFILFYLL